MARFHPGHETTPPAGPPAEVLDEIHAAWERADELAAQGFELHFGRRQGRVAADLCRPGRRSRRLTLREVLELACGPRPPAEPQR
jgi:hypothetical protein